MTQKIQSSKSSQKGASGGEYGLIVGLVSVIAIGAVFGVGTQVKRVFDDASNTLSTPTLAQAPLSLADVKDITLTPIDEDTALLISQQDLLAEKFANEGMSIIDLIEGTGGTLVKEDTTWHFTPTQNFSGTARLIMTVQHNAEDTTKTKTVRVFIPVLGIADTPSLSARIEPVEGVDPITLADFSADGPTPVEEGVRFDMTLETWQSPGEGAENGPYDVMQAVASSYKDTFVFTDPSQTYTLLETDHEDVLSFPEHTADQVDIDGRARTAKVGGGTIHFGNIRNFKFSGNVFDGTPHGLEFAYNPREASGQYDVFEQTPWRIKGKNFIIDPDTNPYPSSRYAPEGYTGYTIEGNDRPIYAVFLDYAGTRDSTYSLDMDARSGLERLENPEDYQGSQQNAYNSANAILTFAVKDIDNMGMVVQRNGANSWSAESLKQGEQIVHTQFREGNPGQQDAIKDGLFYDITMAANDSLARLLVKQTENGQDGEVEKASHDYGRPLNDGRIGVAAQQSYSEMNINLRPTNWAPYAPDISLEGLRNSGALQTPDVLSMVKDPENAALSILSFDATSKKGGRVTRDANTFSYTPPSSGFVGADSFSYVVTDGPNVTQGQIYITVSSENTVDVAPGGDVKLLLTAQPQDAKETLSLSLDNLPPGAVIEDGTRSFTVTDQERRLDLSGWDLETLKISNANVPNGYSFSVIAQTRQNDTVSDIIQRTLSVRFF